MSLNNLSDNIARGVAFALGPTLLRCLSPCSREGMSYFLHRDIYAHVYAHISQKSIFSIINYTEFYYISQESSSKKIGYSS